jgi:hypothetical protein
VVQPWGPDKGRQATLQSEHATSEEAFAALDALREQMVRTGAPGNAIELVVVDERGRSSSGQEATKTRPYRLRTWNTPARVHGLP